VILSIPETLPRTHPSGGQAVGRRDFIRLEMCWQLYSQGSGEGVEAKKRASRWDFIHS